MDIFYYMDKPFVHNLNCVQKLLRQKFCHFSDTETTTEPTSTRIYTAGSLSHTTFSQILSNPSFFLKNNYMPISPKLLHTYTPSTFGTRQMLRWNAQNTKAALPEENRFCTYWGKLKDLLPWLFFVITSIAASAIAGTSGTVTGAFCGFRIADTPDTFFLEVWILRI